MISNFATHDLVRLAMSGGGSTIDIGGRTMHDLIEIARAASGYRVQVTLRGFGTATTIDHLMTIAQYGRGYIRFE